MATDKPIKTSRTKRKSVQEGRAYIFASYNNTIVTLTDQDGNTIAASSAGSSGFKGTRKSTPYAAQVAAENAVGKAKVHGLEKVEVYVKGAGVGRDQSIRGLISAGLDLISITDLTNIPHNGCRKPRTRRV